jgi:hypothetical protein
MSDLNVPTIFGSKVAQAMSNGDPSAVGQYVAQPQTINNVISIIEQNAASHDDTMADIRKQFIKEWIWPLLLPQTEFNAAPLKASEDVNPMK